MILSGDGSRLQTLGGLAAQLFDSTLRAGQHDHIKIRVPNDGNLCKYGVLRETYPVCMILPGGESRLQTLGGLAAQLFDSTLRAGQHDHIKIRVPNDGNLCKYGVLRETYPVCMILPGGESRLQTLGGLAAQLFDSTLRA